MHVKTRTDLSASLVAMLLLTMVMGFRISSVDASPTTYFSVINPKDGTTHFNYTNTNPPPSDANYPLGYLIVNLTVTDVTYLKLWQFNITWDPTLLEIAAPADIYVPADHIFSFAIPGPLLKSINNAAGTAFWGYGAGIGSDPDHFDGSGVCCQIKFNVTRTPVEGETLSCDIHLVTTGFIITKLVGPGGAAMPFTPQDGHYEYVWPPPPPPPVGGIIVLSPENTTYTRTSVPLIFLVNESTYWIGYSLGGQANVTITGNTTLSLSYGHHSVTVYVNYTSGKVGSSETVYFTVRHLYVLNIDSVIDIVDILIVLEAIPSYPDHPWWNPDADLNGDGIVDGIDFVLILIHFGEII